MKSDKIDLGCINHPNFDITKTNYPIINKDLFISKEDYNYLEE